MPYKTYILDEEIVRLIPNNNTEKKIQFYKPKTFKLNETNIFEIKCENCINILYEPYIECYECSQHFCLKCFSLGSENSIHKNIHSYKIIRDDNIRIFMNSDWYANEEKQFLDLLLQYGYGNWDSISKAMINRSPIECREHYLNCYFGGIFEKMLGLTNDSYKTKIIPHFYKMPSIDPPRYDIDDINFKRMGGYRGARSDFDIPFDPSAENLVSNLDVSYSNDDDNNDDIDLYNTLNCAVFNAYNNRLK